MRRCRQELEAQETTVEYSESATERFESAALNTTARASSPFSGSAQDGDFIQQEAIATNTRIMMCLPFNKATKRGSRLLSELSENHTDIFGLNAAERKEQQNGFCGQTKRKNKKKSVRVQEIHRYDEYNKF